MSDASTYWHLLVGQALQAADARVVKIEVRDGTPPTFVPLDAQGACVPLEGTIEVSFRPRGRRVGFQPPDVDLMSDDAMIVHHADGRTATLDPGPLARERVELEREAIAIARANAAALAAIPQALQALATAVQETRLEKREHTEALGAIAKAVDAVSHVVAAQQAMEERWARDVRHHYENIARRAATELRARTLWKLSRIACDWSRDGSELELRAWRENGDQLGPEHFGLDRPLLPGYSVVVAGPRSATPPSCVDTVVRAAEARVRRRRS